MYPNWVMFFDWCSNGWELSFVRVWIWLMLTMGFLNYAMTFGWGSIGPLTNFLPMSICLFYRRFLFESFENLLTSTPSRVDIVDFSSDPLCTDILFPLLISVFYAIWASRLIDLWNADCWEVFSVLEIFFFFFF